MRPIWGYYEVRWIFKVTLVKMGFKILTNECKKRFYNLLPAHFWRNCKFKNSKCFLEAHWALDFQNLVWKRTDCLSRFVFKYTWISKKHFFKFLEHAKFWNWLILKNMINKYNWIYQILQWYFCPYKIYCRLPQRRFIWVILTFEKWVNIRTI